MVHSKTHAPQEVTLHRLWQSREAKSRWIDLLKAKQQVSKKKIKAMRKAKDVQQVLNDQM